MSDILSEPLDPKDIIKIKEKIADETIPCNIWGVIKEILQEIEDLKKVING